MSEFPADLGKTLAVFFTRWVLGLIFFMAGIFKVFEMGALNHARDLFVEPYAETFLPAWSLWLTGTTIPFVELIAGGLLILGFRIRDAGIALGLVLITVTFGHLLMEPFFATNRHIFPRLVLLILVLVWREHDAFSVDYFLERKRSAAST